MPRTCARGCYILGVPCAQRLNEKVTVMRMTEQTGGLDDTILVLLVLRTKWGGGGERKKGFTDVPC